MRTFSKIFLKSGPAPAEALPADRFALSITADGDLTVTNSEGENHAVSSREGTPVLAVKATGTLTSTGVAPVNGATATIGSRVYTFQTALTNVAGNVLIGADAAAALDNLKAAINLTPGVLQVETGTVVGTIEAAGAGNALVVVTAAGMTNSPKSISVAVANDDTASQVGAKIRAALILDANVGHATTGFFTVTGAGADVVLTAKAANYNDATMNIRIDDDTSVGLTNAPTSTNTTAGVAGAGVIYAALTTIHPTVEATTNTDTTQLLVAKTAGTAANAYATTETSSVLSFGAATLTGGIDATPAAKGAQLFDATHTYLATDAVTVSSLTGWRKTAHSAL